jgi:hypothetical protein
MKIFDYSITFLIIESTLESKEEYRNLIPGLFSMKINHLFTFEHILMIAWF